MSRLFALAALAALVVGAVISAQQAEPAKLSAEEQKEKVRERDRLWLEAQRLRDAGKLVEAIAAAERLLVLQRSLLGNGPQEAFFLDFLSELHERRADYAAARPARAQALAIKTKLLGEQHWQVTDARLALADVELNARLTAAQREQRQLAANLNVESVRLSREGKAREGIAVAARALEIRRTVLGEQHRDFALSLHNLAALYRMQGNHAKAEPLFHQALTVRKTVQGENHPDYANSLNSLAVLYEAWGKYDQAEPLYRQSMELRKAVAGDRHPIYADSLNNLAGLYFLRGDYAQAEPLHRQALEIRKAALGEKDPRYANSLNSLGVLYYSQGNHVKAEPLLREAVQIRKAVLGDKHPDYAASLADLAELYKARGDYIGAESLHHQALEIRRGVLGEKHLDFAQSLNYLAMLHDSHADYAKAEQFYRQAMEIRQALLGEKHPYYADSLSNLAALYYSQGDYARAEPLYQQASAIYKAAFGEKHPAYATNLNNQAALYAALKDYARAEPYYLQALEIRKAVLGEKHITYATTLNNLASLYEAQEQYARAEALYRQALEIRKAAHGEKDSAYAGNLNNLALLYRRHGDFARAEPLYRQALEIHEGVLGRRNPDYVLTLTNLASMYAEKGDYAKAWPFFNQALEVTRKHVDLAAAGQSERQQLRMSETVRLRLDRYLSAVIRATEPDSSVFDHVLLWKGSIFLRQLQARLALVDSQLAPLADELRSTSGRLATLALTSPSIEQREAWQRQIRELTEKKEQLEAELSRQSADFRRQQGRRKLTGADLQRTLPAGSVLVDYLEYSVSGPDPEQRSRLKHEQRLAAFVVRPDQPLVLIDLGPAQPITDAIQRWRGSVRRRTGPVLGDDDPAVTLRRLLWQPLEKQIAGAKLVLISPDGALATLPFAALPGQDPSKFLIEEMPLAVVPVPQLIPELLAEQPSRQSPSLLMVGDVDFGAEASAADERGSRSAPTAGASKQWRHLKGTAEEIDALSKLFTGHQPGGTATVLRGGAATEQALRQLAGQQVILHLATHGFFAPPEVKSALAADRRAAPTSGDEAFGRSGISGWHPGLLSGIVLAGANRPARPDRDDGILTATELAGLDLRKLELCVLSACETGLGQSAGGEGLLGLQRAFQVAGARTVAASLWQVPDQATRVLMERFYRNLWEKKLPRLEALREAQLWMLREGRKNPDVARGLELIDEPLPKDDGRLPPYYWAAFVLSGDWR